MTAAGRERHVVQLSVPPLRPGPQHAVPGTPGRAPGSVRRTTSVDITRPDGLLGRVVADVRGQDVCTDAEGVGHVVQRLALEVEIDQRRGEVVVVTVREPTTLRSPSDPSDLGDQMDSSDASDASNPGDRRDPSGAGGPRDSSDRGETSAEAVQARRGLAELVGTNARSGFGRRLAELLPEERDRRSLLYSALDNLSPALRVSGYALLRAGLIPASRERGEQVAQAQADVCIGWASGGPLVESLRRDGISAVPTGPAAPLIKSDDSLGWHPMAPLVTGTVRRRRRLDLVGPRSRDGALVAQAHFRDSYAGDEGEMVMHEYLVDTRIDDRQRLSLVEVDPRVLPWSECPGAVPSADRVVGTAVDEIPARVRTELVGPSTCTHLNSTLRSLADLPGLARLLSERS